MMRTPLGRDDCGLALDALRAWAKPGRSSSSLHVGDVGWFLRFEEDTVRSALALWSDATGPVAVELFDDPGRRITLAPRVEAEPELLTAVVDEIRRDGGPVELAPESGVRTALLQAGWTEDPSPAAHFVLPLSGPIAVDVPYVLVGEADAAARVDVQRSAFQRSTFTVARWRQLHASPAGRYAVDVLVRTPGGSAAAAAIGWFAGPGRCAVLEPVGTHPRYRRRGYGRAVVLATAEELRRLGASAVAVLPPADNEPAVGVYRAAGFEVVGHEHTLNPPAS
ncbi:ribosomal protein S18 acetylase RimI-like enzyme [Hamadaea flava]|uniref:GNAT family N-acetyltransferase n=1 Tax=Hamadaea flava TaxID=1742688 RepID=A0ABV8LSZ1_9ACTN|nr:GNAT family N-acetyltransferase [Hamadaea flava]MCP2328036.1 ribosomal protein S18 acetylase RimI-like enzyme [Hamadaea flava]